MTEVRWYWVAPLALIGIVTLCLIFLFRNKHWLRAIAVIAAGAIFSLFGNLQARTIALLAQSCLLVSY
jgi:type IV secretory pathway VirB2 component (pilin)